MAYLMIIGYLSFILRVSLDETKTLTKRGSGCISDSNLVKLPFCHCTINPNTKKDRPTLSALFSYYSETSKVSKTSSKYLKKT